MIFLFMTYILLVTSLLRSGPGSGTVKGGFARGRKLDVSGPAAAGHGLDPAAFFARGRVRSEIEVGRLATRDVFQLEHRTRRGLVLIGLYFGALTWPHEKCNSRVHDHET